MDACPCGSGRAYTLCCGPYLAGEQRAPTAEALMRSRYTAYVKQNVDYIVATCVRDDKHDIDIDQTRRWSQRSQWRGLKIVSTEKGSSADQKGGVEFIASYAMDGLNDQHHERANFIKKDGVWLYESGEIVPTTITRSVPKIGRNDPCGCGSGRKFKHCCGKGA